MDVAHRLSARVGKALKQRGIKLATAESCTGGWVSQVITSVPGSSAWFDRGFVTYSNASKHDMVGVKPETLDKHGAVSEEVVCQMAVGALANSDAQVSVAISGIAGPEGGSPKKPIGTVWLAWALQGHEPRARSTHYAGDREMVRQQAVMAALQGIIETLEQG